MYISYHGERVKISSDLNHSTYNSYNLQDACCHEFFFFFIIKRTPTLKDKLDEPGRDRKGFECHRVAALYMFFFLEEISIISIFIFIIDSIN